MNVPVVLKAIQQAGGSFLKYFRRTAIPQDKESFWIQLNEIEAQCLTLLKNSLATDYPDTPWRGDEFDYSAQQQPLDLPEYWLCDSMDGAIQYMQHIPGWTINLVLIRNGRRILRPFTIR
jgi:myo-inositol-1(or 4)-monophosphatase